jgi:hypothetical protein
MLLFHLTLAVHHVIAAPLASTGRVLAAGVPNPTPQAPPGMAGSHIVSSALSEPVRELHGC